MPIRVVCPVCGKEGLLKAHNVKIGSKIYHYWYIEHKNDNKDAVMFDNVHNLSNREAILSLIMYIYATNKIDQNVINGIAELIYAVRDILDYQFDNGELSNERAVAILKSLDKLEKSINDFKSFIKWVVDHTD